MTKTRIALEDGGYFVPSLATKWEDEYEFDGNNFVSLSTGSQWDHETLYKTATGNYVLRRHCDWQGSGPDRFNRIDPSTAAQWLLNTRQDLPEDLAEEIEEV